MQDYVMALTAGVEKNLQVSGNFFHVLYAASPVMLSFDNNSAKTTRPQGMGQSREYTSVTVSSDVTQNVTLILGFGTVTDNRNVGNTGGAGGGAAAVAVLGANIFEDIADAVITAGTALTLAAADATRIELLVFNPSTNLNDFRLGDSPTASSGVLLQPGFGTVVTGTAAVKAFNTGATDEALTLSQGRYV